MAEQTIMNISFTCSLKTSITVGLKCGILKAMASANDCTVPCKRSSMLSPSEKSYIKPWMPFRQIWTNGYSITMKIDLTAVDTATVQLPCKLLLNPLPWQKKSCWIQTQQLLNFLIQP